MSRQDRTFALAIGTLFSAGLLTLASAAFLEGCKAQPCTPTALDPDDPSPAIECPSGELCYQGACIRACSAGQERAQACASDGDCDSARPRCVDNFCSICDQREICIPTLNVCQPVIDVELPEPPPMPMPGMRPPAPLDAGPLDGGSYLDGGLTRILDAGVAEPPPELEVTQVGVIALGQIEDYRSSVPPTSQSTAYVAGWDVTGNGVGLKWRADVFPAVIQCQDDDEDRDGCGAQTNFEFEQCVIRPFRVVTPQTGSVPTPTDLGVIQIDSHGDFPGSLAVPITATFDPMFLLYALSPQTPPNPLLNFSAPPFAQSYLSVSSAGVAGLTLGSWPDNPSGAFLGHHVPYRLEPSADTELQLSSRPIISNPAQDDLIYQWSRIDTGNDNFERVVVRMLGMDHELYCDAIEGRNGEDTIVIPAATLNEWRVREPAGIYSVEFSRISVERLQIDAVLGALIDMSVRVSHTLISEVEIQ